MKLACARFLVCLWAFFGVFVLAAGTASAAGSLTWGKTHIQETSGSWHLQMTIIYGGKPPMAHVPMRFSFTRTAYFESYLDDKHGDKPQKRTIPMTGQLPINESVDVDFADTRGKIFDRTRFDFNISRSHNFEAGEYDVVVHRADGAQIGAKTKIILEGDNPVIDRRAISFVDSSKKKDDKPATAATAAPAGGESAPAAESTPAAASESSPDPASSASPAAEEAPDPTAAAKVPPGGSKGCGCHLSGSTTSSGAFLTAGLLGLAFLRVRGRSSRRRVG